MKSRFLKKVREAFREGVAQAKAGFSKTSSRRNPDHDQKIRNYRVNKNGKKRPLYPAAKDKNSRSLNRKSQAGNRRRLRREYSYK